MQIEAPDERLSLIPTLWSLVCRAHQGPAETAKLARAQLLDRYGGAAQRYLRHVLRDHDGADEVFQEFAMQVLHGNLRGADPQRGRFRNFVKGTLFHLMADYRRRRRQWPGPLPPSGAEPAAQPVELESDRRFIESWRDELLARAWTKLQALEAGTGQLYYTVLRYRADHAEQRSPQMAEELAAQLGKLFRPAALRQMLHRAREKFAEHLLEEVAHSLEEPDMEHVRQELAELALLDYCRPALERQTS